MALGATRNDIVRLVLRQGVAMTVLGVGVGLFAAVAFSRLLQSLLFQVSPTAPAAYVFVGVSLTAVALLATALPAHKAASIDPLSSLRSE